jgi:hypothetical protein
MRVAQELRDKAMLADLVEQIQLHIAMAAEAAERVQLVEISQQEQVNQPVLAVVVVLLAFQAQQ